MSEQQGAPATTPPGVTKKVVHYPASFGLGVEIGPNGPQEVMCFITSAGEMHTFFVDDNTKRAIAKSLTGGVVLATAADMPKPGKLQVVS